MSRGLGDVYKRQTFNISFKGAHLADIEKVIDCLEQHHVRAEFIIFDVDFANFRNPDDADSGESDVLPSTRLPSELAIAAATFPSVRSVYDFSRRPPDMASEQFNYLPLPKDVLPRDPSPAYDAAFRRVLTRMKGMSKNVIAYVPPFAVEAFGHYGFDVPAFRYLAAYYVAVCHELGVDCLDLSGALPLSDFVDIIHLNQRGHAYLARRLEREIGRQRGAKMLTFVS